MMNEYSFIAKIIDDKFRVVIDRNIRKVLNLEKGDMVKINIVKIEKTNSERQEQTRRI